MMDTPLIKPTVTLSKKDKRYIDQSPYHAEIESSLYTKVIAKYKEELENKDANALKAIKKKLIEKEKEKKREKEEELERLRNGI